MVDILPASNPVASGQAADGGGVTYDGRASGACGWTTASDPVARSRESLDGRSRGRDRWWLHMRGRLVVAIGIVAEIVSIVNGDGPKVWTLSGDCKRARGT